MRSGAISALPAMLRHDEERRESGKSDEDIHDPDEHRPAAEEHLDDIHVECTDESPVESTDDHENVPDAAVRRVLTHEIKGGKSVKVSSLSLAPANV